MSCPLFFRRLVPILVTGLALLLPSLPATAADIITAPSITRDVRDVGKVKPRKLILPYGFYTDSLGLAVGVAVGASAFPREHSSLFGTGYVSTNKSYDFHIISSNVRIPPGKRLFLDTTLSLGWFTDQRAYVNGNPDYPEERAGSNDSDQDDYIEGEGWRNELFLKFKYVMPMGNARDEALHTYTLQRGLLAEGPSGAKTWNPLESGITLLELVPFFSKRTFDLPDGGEGGKTNGLIFGLTYENRDYSSNPSKGSILQVKVTRDFGWFDSNQSWTNVAGEFNKYFSLGESKHFRQRVIALSFWTADSPTWETEQVGDTRRLQNTPPPTMGSTLGGNMRLRGYSSNRFTDKAAIYYGAEYRTIPQWNPLGSQTWLKWLDIDWWQWVGFVEAGRVADKWDFGELNSDLKWDGGFGLRSMMRKVVVRLDFAFSEEGTHVWAMAGQPF
jgi:outer membrane protein assembly factor BamA